MAIRVSSPEILKTTGKDENVTNRVKNGLSRLIFRIRINMVEWVRTGWPPNCPKPNNKRNTPDGSHSEPSLLVSEQDS